jgi:hypothetical protein
MKEKNFHFGRVLLRTRVFEVDVGCAYWRFGVCLQWRMIDVQLFNRQFVLYFQK